MKEIYYEFPPYALEIIEKLKKRDWLIHSFNLNDKMDCYNPSAYLQNTEFNNIQYEIYLDLNIYQYVLSAYKKQKKEELHRDAIALIVFGKFTNIMFEPGLAIYEKINYSPQCEDEIINDLALFREIDNSDMDGLAKFALGYTSTIQLPQVTTIDSEKKKLELTKYKRLKKWDSLYLIILQITKLYYFDESSNEEKIIKFLKWSSSDFMYSLVAISFLIRLFGKKPLPKLMKYKKKYSISSKKDSLNNMTWDLFLLDSYFESWIKKPKNSQFLYASNDKSLKVILELAISTQVSQSFLHISEFVDNAIIKELDTIAEKMSIKDGRKYYEVSDFKSYRDELINENELIILNG